MAESVRLSVTRIQPSRVRHIYLSIFLVAVVLSAIVQRQTLIATLTPSWLKIVGTEPDYLTCDDSETSLGLSGAEGFRLCMGMCSASPSN